MATADTVKDSSFIYADDFTNAGEFIEKEVTIAGVAQPGTIAYANKRQNSKPALQFERTPKVWEVPKTQYRLLQMMLGKEESKWTGQKITLRAALCKSPQDGECPAVRIVPTINTTMIPIGIRKWFGKPLTGQKTNA